MGSILYYKAVALISGPDSPLFRHLEMDIQDHFIGPDCYWKPPDAPVPGCTRFFGDAWWIPFPPTLVRLEAILCRMLSHTHNEKVIRYDDGPLRALQDLSQLEEYVSQNSSPHVRRKREIRLALRALDGLVVIWPFDYVRVSCMMVFLSTLYILIVLRTSVRTPSGADAANDMTPTP